MVWRGVKARRSAKYPFSLIFVRAFHPEGAEPHPAENADAAIKHLGEGLACELGRRARKREMSILAQLACFFFRRAEILRGFCDRRGRGSPRFRFPEASRQSDALLSGTTSSDRPRRRCCRRGWVADARAASSDCSASRSRRRSPPARPRASDPARETTKANAQRQPSSARQLRRAGYPTSTLNSACRGVL